MIIYILIILFFAIIIYSYIENKFIKVRTYSLNNLPSKFKTVIISDLHGMRFGKNNKRLLKLVDSQNPDFVIIAGDLITWDIESSVSVAEELIEALRSKYNIVYAPGNHESRLIHYDKHLYEEYVSFLLNHNVVYLENNQYIALYDNMSALIYGLELPTTFFKKTVADDEIKKYIKTPVLSNDIHVNILIAHDPEYFDYYIEGQYDIIISGHMHGGIVRLPFINGIISPRMKLFPKYCGGIYEKDKSTMIVSRGLGMHTIPFRLFNRPELVVLKSKGDCSEDI